MDNKRITYVILPILMLCFLTPTMAVMQTYNVGVLMSFHRLGFKSAQTQFERTLMDAGLEVNYKYENAENDLETARNLIQQFKSDGVDLIHTIGTVATQAAILEAGDIPILYSAVPSPVKDGIIDSMNATGGNISGTINANPINKQIDLFQEIYPNAKVWGTIYNPDDELSASATETAKKALESRGMILKTATIHSIRSHQVGDAAVKLLDSDIDIMFLIRDKTANSSISAVIHNCEDQQTPVVSGNIFAVPMGAAAALGWKYIDIGENTAKKAEKVLRNKEAIKSMHAGDELDHFTIFVSPKNAKKLSNASIPQKILTEADRVF